MSKVFFTSDNHFSHKNIHSFCPTTRPDADWKTMDQKMILQWQNQVRQEDIVYMLGDVFFCPAEDAIKIMQRLPGQKHLIFGNHDKAIRNNSILRGMFASHQEYKEIKLGAQEFVLFHYPIQEWNKMHRGAINCYGHIHHALSDSGGRTVNVCVDSPEMYDGIPYQLFPADDVVRHALTAPIRRHHDKVIL
jgi:calcineurin-like phosphoesterase family protein